MLLKRRAIMLQHSSAPQRRLPYDYQELAYIESTGTQYINPSFSIDCTTDYLSIDASWTNTGTVQIVGGMTTGTSATRYAVFQQRTDNCIGFDIQDYTKRVSSSITGYGTRHFIETDKNKLYVDGSYIGASTGVNSSNVAIIYFGVLNDSTYPCRIYSSIIKRNGIAVRNLIPAMRYSDKVAGLYDTVNDVFYTNQGTGEFKMGPWVPYRLPEDFQEVEWIGTSTANSYIDINWTPQAGTGVRIKAKRDGGTYATGGHLISAQTANAGLWLVWRPAPQLYTSSALGEIVHNFTETGRPQVIDIATIDNSAKIDGVTFETVTLPSTITTSKLRLFNYATYATTKDYTFYGKLYSLDFYYGGSIIKTFVPCYRISDNAIGVYDIQGNTFYPKSNGTFTKGPNLPKRLPDEYQEVEWVSDQNEQEYLNTGVIPTNTTGLRIEISGSDIVTDHFWLGCLNGTGKRLIAGCSSGRVYLGWNTNAFMPSGTSITANVFNTFYINYRNDRKRAVNDQIITDTLETLNAIGYPLNLWRTNNQGGLGYSHGTKKIRSCIITSETTEIRNFVPCYRKADNVIGFYDLCGSICPLTGTPFYINAGSGTFTKGADV